MSIINILLVEDQTLTRMGMKITLNHEDSDCRIVAEASSVKEALAQLGQLPDLDIVLLDLMLPDGNGIEVIEHMRETGSKAKVLVISADTNRETILKLTELGIGGFISKYADSATLEEAIYSVHNGLEYFGKDIAEVIHAISTAKAQEEDTFTDRELEIMQLCANGLNVKQIAKELNISSRTVETHKNNIFKKLGFSSTAELMKYAFEHGIIRD
ncbi:MAG: response regulator transcription factor [Bacteroidales bacterium]|nr:response regulator transcription factor [Bacteroidales bacterium]